MKLRPGLTLARGRDQLHEHVPQANPRCRVNAAAESIIAEALIAEAAKLSDVEYADGRANLAHNAGMDVSDFNRRVEQHRSYLRALAEVPRQKLPSPIIPPVARATVQPLPALATSARLLDDFAVAIHDCGVVGEIATAQLLYLVLTSRLLDKPVSAVIKGLSASGKSFTTEQVLRFFPPEAVVVLTGMSERSLIYSKDDYKHRVIVLFEATALREGVEDNLTAYLVRSLLSEGRLNYEVTVRDPAGGWTTKKITKEGPTGLILTTTRTNLHPENETRMLALNTNDSREQTKSIFRALANKGTSAPGNLEPWLALQTWLQPAEHRVVIPFAAALAELIPPVAVRLRRDFSLLLSLIEAHAILHQATRRRDTDGRIVATVKGDYSAVRELTADVISEGVGATVKGATRETAQAVEQIAEPEGVSALAVGAKLKLDKATISRRLAVAARSGYIRNLETHRGKPGRWVIGEPLPDRVAILPQPQQLENGTFGTPSQAQQGSCTVARAPEEYMEVAL